MQPAPAPRFSATPATLTTPPSKPGADTRDALTAWGIDDVDALIADGVAVTRLPRQPAMTRRHSMKRTIFEADHDAFRDTVRTFCDKEIAPHHEQWEKAAHRPARALDQGRRARACSAS